MNKKKGELWKTWGNMKTIYKIYFKKSLIGEVYTERDAETFRQLGFEVIEPIEDLYGDGEFFESIE